MMMANPTHIGSSPTNKRVRFVGRRAARAESCVFPTLGELRFAQLPSSPRPQLRFIHALYWQQAEGSTLRQWLADPVKCRDLLHAQLRPKGSGDPMLGFSDSERYKEFNWIVEVRRIASSLLRSYC